MASYSDKETDKLLAELEGRIVEVYDKAQSEVAKQASDYFASFKDRYEKEYAAFEEGKYTPQQFAAWYQAQVGRGERWNHLRDSLAQRLTEANKVAAAYVNDTTPGIYALNANYQAYEIYNNTGVDFALVDENTVKRLFMDEKLDILPLNLNVDESERWNAKQLTNALTSGIIRGQSIGKIANEFQRVTNMDRTSALRNARTATTGAQNAGRQESYDKAAEMGIEIEKEWIATEDSRTRESHAEMDGVRIKYSETFPNGLEYPGDPNGAPEEVYNCRCTVRAIIPKYNGDQRESHIEGHEGLHTKESYKEWVDRKREEKMENSKPYTHADATERAMAAVEDRQSNSEPPLVKNVDIDDVDVMIGGKEIDPEVRSEIKKYIKEIESNSRFIISEVSNKVVDDGKAGTPLFQTEVINYGRGNVGIKLNINEEMLRGRTLDEINEKIYNAKSTVAENIKECLIHESKHMDLIWGKTYNEVQELYKELLSQGIDFNYITEADGDEALADMGVLLSRKDRDVSKYPEEERENIKRIYKLADENMDFYNKYLGESK